MLFGGQIHRFFFHVDCHLVLVQSRCFWKYVSLLVLIKWCFSMKWPRFDLKWFHITSELTNWKHKVSKDSSLLKHLLLCSFTPMTITHNNEYLQSSPSLLDHYILINYPSKQSFPSYWVLIVWCKTLNSVHSLGLTEYGLITSWAPIH